MNFEDERYVRVYTRKTVTTKLLGWDGRMCLHALLLEVDRAGVLDLEGLDPAEALAAVADLPLDHAQTGMAKLLARKVVVVTNGVLFVPNFIRAQEAKQSDAQRQRESRARRAAAVRAAELPGVPPELVAVAVTVLETASHHVTIRDTESPPVTESHTRSHAVTIGHSSSAVPSCTKPSDLTPPPKDLTGLGDPLPAVVVVPRSADSGKVPCPADLQLDAAQHGRLRLDMAMTDHQIDSYTRAFRTANASNRDHRTLDAWRRSLVTYACSKFHSAHSRPPRSADEPETDDQMRRRLRSGPRQPNKLDHSTPEAHLRAIGATEE